MRTRFGSLLLVLLSGMAAVAAPLNGPERIDFLVGTLEESSDFKLRIAAAEELGRFADGSVADWMLRAFRRERNPAVRLSILYAVGQIPDARVIPPLLELANEEVLGEGELLAVERVLWNDRQALLLPAWEAAARGSSDRKERATAAWLLGIAGTPEMLPALERASEDPSPFVRVRALTGIARLGKPREALPEERDFRVDLKADRSTLETAVVTPETFRDYLAKNVNPRPVEVASESLREPSRAEERTDRTVSLFRDERLRETISLDAVLFTPHRFRAADLGRLRETVREGAGSVNQCYLKGVERNRKLGGTLSARFRVLADGRVSQAEISGGTLPDPEVRECVRRRISGFRFPSIPVEFVSMNYTFTFRPPEDQKIIFGSAR